LPEELIERARQGDHDAFASLARTTSPRLYALAIRILRDAQEALVEIWRSLRALREADRFEAWSTRILVRICYREARRLRSSVTIADDPPGGAGDPYRPLADRDQLERGFRRLKAEQRALLVLRHYLDLEPSEIARTLGIPPGTARSRLHYAHEAMRAALEAEARSSGFIEVIQ
jgi:RNA polymerase sigma-70 factor (ECF subfamily)